MICIADSSDCLSVFTVAISELLCVPKFTDKSANNRIKLANYRLANFLDGFYVHKVKPF